jgi:hypothetical protein
VEDGIGVMHAGDDRKRRQATVRNTAAGSLLPDSSSSRWRSRETMATSLERRTEKTAAGRIAEDARDRRLSGCRPCAYAVGEGGADEGVRRGVMLTPTQP